MEPDQAAWAPGLWITDTGEAIHADPCGMEVASVLSAAWPAGEDPQGIKAASCLQDSELGARAIQPPSVDGWREALAATSSWSLDAEPWPQDFPEYWQCGDGPQDACQAIDPTSGWCNAWPSVFAADYQDGQESAQGSNGGDGWSEAAAAAGLFPLPGDPGTEQCSWGPESGWPDMWQDGDEWDATFAGDGLSAMSPEGDCWSAEQWEAFRNGAWFKGSGRFNNFKRGPNSGTSPPMLRVRSHSFVPRRVDLESQYKQYRESGQEVTSMMIRNVPNRYSRQNLMEELNDAGFEGKFDFVYIPVDNATKWNVGYAFVNFEDPADCRECMIVFDGREFKREIRAKPRPDAIRKRLAQVALAHLQGLRANIEHISGKSVFFSGNAAMRPWVKPSAMASLPEHLHLGLGGDVRGPEREHELSGGGCTLEQITEQVVDGGDAAADEQFFFPQAGADDAAGRGRFDEDTIKIIQVDDRRFPPLHDCRSVGTNGFPTKSALVDSTSMIAEFMRADDQGEIPLLEKEEPWDGPPARQQGRGRPSAAVDYTNVGQRVATFGSRRSRLLVDGSRWPPIRPPPTVQRQEVPPPPRRQPPISGLSETLTVDDAVLDFIPINGAGFSEYSGEAGVKAFSAAWSAAVAKFKPGIQATSLTSRQGVGDAVPKGQLEASPRKPWTAEAAAQRMRSAPTSADVEGLEFDAANPREAAAFLAKRRAPSMPAMSHALASRTRHNTEGSDGAAQSGFEASSTSGIAGAATIARGTALSPPARRRRQSQPSRRRSKERRHYVPLDLHWGFEPRTQAQVLPGDGDASGGTKASVEQATWTAVNPSLEETGSSAPQEEWPPDPPRRRNAIPLSEHDIRLSYMCPEASMTGFFQEGTTNVWPATFPWKDDDSVLGFAAEGSFRQSSQVPVHGFAAAAMAVGEHLEMADTCWVSGKEVTTLVVRNLPSDFAQETLLAELRFLGLTGSCNFLYLPMDAATSWNIGSAFLNFRSPEDAEHARSVLEGHVWQSCAQGTDERSSRKKASVDTAVIQGLEDNVMHYCMIDASFQGVETSAQPLVFPQPGIVMTATWELLDPNSECALVHWDSANNLREMQEHCPLSAINPWVELQSTANPPGLVPMVPQDGEFNAMEIAEAGIDMNSASGVLGLIPMQDRQLNAADMGEGAFDYIVNGLDYGAPPERMHPQVAPTPPRARSDSPNPDIRSTLTREMPDWQRLPVFNGFSSTMSFSNDADEGRWRRHLPSSAFICGGWAARGHWGAESHEGTTGQEESASEFPAADANPAFARCEVAPAAMLSGGRTSGLFPTSIASSDTSIERFRNATWNDARKSSSAFSGNDVKQSSNASACTNAKQLGNASSRIGAKKPESIGKQAPRKSDTAADARAESPDEPPLGLEWPTLSQKPSGARRSSTNGRGQQATRRGGAAKSAATRAPKAAQRQASPLRAGGA